MASCACLVSASAIVLCVLGCFTTVMGLTDEQVALMKQLHDTCVGETGVDEAAIDNCRKGTFADDPKLKCYMKCTFEQVAVMDEDGVIDGDAMIAMLPEELAEAGVPIVKKCVTVKGSDACDAAYQFNKCLYETDPSKYMII